VTTLLLAAFLAAWIVYIVQSPNRNGYLSWPLWVFIFFAITAFATLIASVQRCIVYQSLLNETKEPENLETVVVSTTTTTTNTYPSYVPESLSPGSSYVPTSEQNNIYQEPIYQPNYEPAYEAPPNVYVYNQPVFMPPYNPDSDVHYLPQQPTQSSETKQ
jgi:hypothetical protein